jgi:Flp pilus assembly pilin Flp
LDAKIQSTDPCGKETLMGLILSFACDETGSPATEYAIILAILGIALITSISSLSTTLTGIFSDMAGRLTGS